MTQEQFQTLAETVAKQLGYVVEDCDNFRRAGDDTQCKIKDPNSDKAFYFYYGGWKNEGRLKAYGIYPRNHKGQLDTSGLEHTSITMSPAKTPEQIAKDLQRRFFPEYNSNYDTVVERNRRALEYDQEKDYMLEIVAKALGVNIQKVSYNDSKYIPVHSVKDKFKGLCAIDYCHRDLEVRLRLKAEDTVKLLDFLKTL